MDIGQPVKGQHKRDYDKDYFIYQSAINSTVHACRAIYYIDIAEKTLDIIYPLGKDGKPTHSTYEQELSDRFKYGVVKEEHIDAVMDFLNFEKLAQRLTERDHLEFQFERVKKFDVLNKKRGEKDYEWCSIAVTITDRDKDGKPLTYTMAIRSIDDMMELEEKQKEILKLAVARAETASRAKSDFLSRMSHDIRTPMNAILGLTAIAAINIDDKARVLDALKKITASGKHLLGLINEVLDMSRIESGKIHLNEGYFNLSDTIENFLTIFHSQIKAKNLNLQVIVSKLIHDNVIGDEQHLQQIFMNIMGNAVKFTDMGGSITIRISEKENNIYEFVFEDTGIGMEPEFISQIFEPFARAKNSIGNKIEGTGLGMPIAMNIAKMMGGDIKVESEIGRGSKFTVSVCLKPNEVKQEEINSLEELSVLVVDDEEDTCINACAILEDIGMKAEYVLDGNSAVKRLSQAEKDNMNFSVVILDWKMPEKDGLATAKEIRQTISGDIPIIILSAYDWGDIEKEALECGVNAFIAKPLFKSRLIKVLYDVFIKDKSKSAQTALDAFCKQDYTGKRVLLVEDNDLNTEVAQELLKIVGIQVETAENGKIAVERILQKEAGYYDLIFMDIQMPIMNGYEATRAIRESGREDLNWIPIIAMTADAFTDDKQKAKEAGMNDHVYKPVDLERLEATLKKWI